MSIHVPATQIPYGNTKLTVEPLNKEAVEDGIQEIKEAFRKHAACHPNVFVWIEKPIIQEKEAMAYSTKNGNQLLTRIGQVPGSYA